MLRCQKGQSGSLAGEMYPCHEKQTKNPAETTGNRYKIVILMGETVRKVKHSSVRIENPLSALYRGTEYFGLARTFRTAWGADAEKLKGLVAASLRLKTFNDNPYLKFQSI